MSGIFGRSWVLLRRNPVMVLPAIGVALISALTSYALAPSGIASWGFFGNLDAQGPAAFWSFFGTVVALALRLFWALIAITFTVGMAAAAWERGTAGIADGWNALRRRGLQLLLVLVLLFLIGSCASALFIATFAISVLAYMVFAIYAIPAVVVGNRAAPDAIVESIRIAAKNIGPTVALVALIVVLALLGALLGLAAGRVPFLGDAISWIVMQLVVAYATIAVVGEYRSLASGQPD